MSRRRRGRAADVPGIVAARLPGYRITSVEPLGEGLDNLAYEVNGELVVRFAKETDPVRRGALVDREARLLAAVAGISPLPVPEPVFTVAEQGCLAYRKLPGVPLLELPRHGRAAHAASIGAGLGGFLAALHAVPAGRLAGLVDADHQPTAEWRRQAAADHGTVAGRIPAEHRRPVEAFLAAAPPDDEHTPVFSHNDLGIEHVLVDPVTWAVTGVVDWSDAAVVDPARDFGLLHRDLGPAATRAAVHRYRTGTADPAALVERAVFYARCGVFEDLAHGIGTGRDRYVTKSLTALDWLFAS
ncbi:phosphotransferase family protein [Streptomyces sp. NPDC001288]|uniref:phosphotransferase family protein n=1 Tax=Streptomyces sp. NPDC001297 TaxID=3364559 RepID=UPI003682C100